MLMMTPGHQRSKERRRALVTGGAIRVGRAVALALADAGMDVAIGYHRSGAEAARTRRALEQRGARAAAIQADLGQPAAAARLVREAARALGGLDVLVNGAALFVRTPVATTSARDWDRLLALNLRAAFLCAQAAVRAMPRPGGHIVNIGDAGADRAWPSYIPYIASKAGLVALTRGLAAALRPARIAVNCVAPGAVLRPPGFPPGRWREISGAHPPTLDDVTAAVTFFASCPAGITGQVLAIEGGRGADTPSRRRTTRR
jgi:NAD(P)-dependent dehydrogenase (short-subunit alcohol dehydrogenase family)